MDTNGALQSERTVELRCQYGGMKQVIQEPQMDTDEHSRAQWEVLSLMELR